MIKLQINVKSLFIHFLLLTAIFVVNTPLVLLPALLVVLIYFIWKKDYNGFLIGGIYSLCMNSEIVYYGYSILVMILVFSSHRKYNSFSFIKIKKQFLWLIIYLFITYIIQLTYNGSILSLPLFIVTFLSPIAIFFYIGKLRDNVISIPYIVNNILYIAIVQVFLAFFLQAIPVGISTILNRATYGDRVQGTVGSAPNLAFLLAASILPFLFNIFNKSYSFKSKVRILALLVIFIAMMFLNDAKTILYALCISLLVSYLLNKFFINKKLTVKLSFLFLSIIILAFSINIVVGFAIDKYRPYIYGKYDAKALYYQYAFSFKTRPAHEYIIGTGPGTNGSRASNALAYDVMYKKENTVTLPSFIPPKSSSFTRRYLSRLFTKDYAESSGNRSALLGNPFNSICAVFIEFGVMGTALFIAFLVVVIKQIINAGNSVLAKTAFFLLLAIMVTAFLDQTLESQMDMHMMYMLLGLSLRKQV